MYNASLKKKKFCILYSYTLFPLRYRFFTAGDKDIADFSFIGTDIMSWYCFIMTCISLTAPPNHTPYLLPFFPTSKYGPWMSLREEHCFAMVELESCDCVRHRFITSSPGTSPYWAVWCKEKGTRGRAACKKRRNLSGHTMEKGQWCCSARLPCYGSSAERGLPGEDAGQTVPVGVRRSGAELWEQGL